MIEIEVWPDLFEYFQGFVALTHDEYHDSREEWDVRHAVAEQLYAEFLGLTDLTNPSK